MGITLRDYQENAVMRSIDFMKSQTTKNGLIVIPTGGGKSWIIAELALRLGSDVLVLCPNAEILSQNYDKMEVVKQGLSSIYSASFNRKEISRITFATIGSIMAHKEDFDHFKYIIVDEAHVTNPKGGMYKEFFECADRRILGLTATPYRLSSSRDQCGDPKCILKFLTRTRPRIFSEVVYQVDISTLMQRGYLSPMRYFDMTILPPANIKRNSTGMDFDDDDLKAQMHFVDLQTHLINIVRRLQNTKDGVPRKGILVFTKFLEESEALCDAIPGCQMVSGETSKKERERILTDFKDGKIQVLTNVGILTTGFDYPELDTIVIARPTMSLALYYQIVGRAIRPHPSKTSGWVVDLAGNIERFGRVEDLHLSESRPGMYAINSHTGGRVKQLTQVFF